MKKWLVISFLIVHSVAYAGTPEPVSAMVKVEKNTQGLMVRGLRTCVALLKKFFEKKAVRMDVRSTGLMPRNFFLRRQGVNLSLPREFILNKVEAPWRGSMDLSEVEATMRADALRLLPAGTLLNVSLSHGKPSDELVTKGASELGILLSSSPLKIGYNLRVRDTEYGTHFLNDLADWNDLNIDRVASLDAEAISRVRVAVSGGATGLFTDAMKNFLRGSYFQRGYVVPPVEEKNSQALSIAQRSVVTIRFQHHDELLHAILVNAEKYEFLTLVAAENGEIQPRTIFLNPSKIEAIAPGMHFQALTMQLALPAEFNAGTRSDAVEIRRIGEDGTVEIYKKSAKKTELLTARDFAKRFDSEQWWRWEDFPVLDGIQSAVKKLTRVDSRLKAEVIPFEDDGRRLKVHLSDHWGWGVAEKGTAVVVFENVRNLEHLLNRISTDCGRFDASLEISAPRNGKGHFVHLVLKQEKWDKAGMEDVLRREGFDFKMLSFTSVPSYSEQVMRDIF